MEIDLYNCPHCFTKGVIKTIDNLCPNCKQILTDENKVNPEEPINEQISENNNIQSQDVMDDGVESKKILQGVLPGAIICLGIILTYVIPIMLLQEDRDFQIIDLGTEIILFLLLIASGSILIIVGLNLSKLPIGVKIVFIIVIFLSMIPYFFILAIISLRPWHWGP